ncbi:MAG: hypothetical protein F4229_16880 [Gammaproteobacteria bacterium]|nr:hypothetical protein [Gammaproteobacteria bacterium]MYF12621.1 hypothetical protein [Gammaproteobacteria bacterium]MYH14889.1 hypothetical protein [Gammaproteobacteria bacterium]
MTASMSSPFLDGPWEQLAKRIDEGQPPNELRDQAMAYEKMVRRAKARGATLPWDDPALVIQVPGTGVC